MALPIAACSNKATKQQVAATKGSPAGVDVSAMDKSVKPGDDFFA